MGNLLPDILVLIDDVLSEGQELTARQILDQMYFKIEQKNNREGYRYYKGHHLPSTSSLSYHLKNKQYNYKQTNKGILFWK
jgi:hypothetical protein